jgi:hypothetical protein
MTTDAYGRYVGRHVRFKDMPPGYALGDPTRPANKLSGRMDDPEPADERYDRPVFTVPTQRSVP